jgi:hypothetical protein
MLKAAQATVFVGTSLDGFTARANGALGFLEEEGGEPHRYDWCATSGSSALRAGK